MQAIKLLTIYVLMMTAAAFNVFLGALKIIFINKSLFQCQRG